MSLKRLPLALALVCSRLAASVLAQDQNVQFNQVVNLNGDMQLNRITLPDQSRIETFSQTQQQLIVNQNPAPLPASHVVGSTGQPFVQLSAQAMTIQTNNANDLVGGQIIMPIDRNMLQQNQILVDNTFMAKLSTDRQAWVIMEEEKTVNEGESNVRMVRQTNIDGEYMVVGRRTPETGASLAPFSQDPNQAVRIEGSGIQEVEFQDGFRMSVRASQPMAIQADVVNGVSANMIVSGAQPVNNYRYLVTSNLAGVVPDLNRMAAVVQIPLNGQRLMQSAQQMGAGPNDLIALSIEQRAVIQNPGGAAGQLRPAPQRRQETSAPPAESATSAPPGEAATSAAPEASASPPPAEGQQPPPAEAQQPPPAEAQQPPPAEGQQPPPAEGQQPPPQGQQPPPPNNLPPAATQLLLEPTFTPIARQTLLDEENSRVAVPVDQVDGEFILVMELGAPGQPGQLPGGQLPGGQLPGGQLPGGQLPGAQLPGGQQQQQPPQGENPTREQPQTPGSQIPGQARPEPGQFQRIPGGMVPGQTQPPVGGTMGMIPIENGSAPAVPQPPQQLPQQPAQQLPQQPALTKRQQPGASPMLGQPGKIMMTMAQIEAMAMRQTAGAGWVGIMIDQYVSQSTGQPMPDRKPDQPRPELPAQAPAPARRSARFSRRSSRRAPRL